MKQALTVFALCLFTSPAGLSYANPFNGGDADVILDSLGSKQVERKVQTRTNRDLAREDFSSGIVISSMGDSLSIARGIGFYTDGKFVVAGRCYQGTDPDVCLAKYRRDGTFDTAFHTTGRVYTAFGFIDDWIHGLQIQTDGRIVVAGRSGNGQNLDFGVLRYLSDGSLDTSFGTTGGVKIALGTENDYARAVKIDTTGRILVAGYFVDDLNYNSAIIRLSTNGNLDTSFASTGKKTLSFSSGTSSLTSIEVQTDGAVIVTGGEHSGTWDAAFARLTSDGALDTSFATKGFVTFTFGTDTDFIYNTRQDTTGRLYGVGLFQTGTQLEGLVVRVRTNGTLDTSFELDGYYAFGPSAFDNALYNLYLNTDGGVMAVGYSSSDGTLSGNDFAILRLTSAGDVDGSWNGTGYTITTAGADADELFAITRNSFREFVAIGQVRGADWNFAVARYQSDGSLAPSGALDYSFGTNGQNGCGVGGGAYKAIGFGRDPLTGRIMLSGSPLFTNTSYYCRFLSSGALDTSFFTSGIRYVTNFRMAQNFAFDSSGVTYATGSSVVARLKVDGTFDTAFATIGYGGANTGGKYSVIDPQGRLIYSFENYYTGGVSRMRSNGSLDTSFNTTGMALGTTPLGNGKAIFFDTIGKISLLGYATRWVNGNFYDLVLSRMNSNGSADTSFNTTGFQTLTLISSIFGSQSIKPLPDGSMIGIALHNYMDSPYRVAVIRYLTDGSIDTSFNGTGILSLLGGYPNAHQDPNDLLITSSNQIYVSSDTYDEAGNNRCSVLTRIKTDGRLDTAFGTHGSSAVLCDSAYTVMEDAAGTIIVGYNGSGIRGYLP